MSERQSGMPQEREGELRLPTHSREARAQWRTQRRQVRGTDVRQLARFDVAPELFDGVQLRCVGGQPLDGQPGALRGQKDHDTALVPPQAIPDEQDTLPGKVALEVAEKGDEGDVRVGPRQRLEEETRPAVIPPKRQRAGDGEALPGAAGVDQDRRFAAGS